MAPRGPAKGRDFDYSNVGKAGRRTGITLKEGKLDEHGMEEIEGMFSSPEKSPARTNGNGFTNNASLNSEDMETGESSIPEPAELLSNRRAQRNTYLPPPRSRSPIKTFLSGSPRRTPGMRSSPFAHDGQSSSPTTARAQARRRVDLSAQLDAASSPEEIPHDDQDEESNADFSDDGNHLLDDAEEEATYFHADGDHTENIADQGGESPQTLGADDNEDGDDPDDAESPSILAQSTAKGRKRKNTPSQPPEGTEPLPKSTSDGSPKRRGRKPKGTSTTRNPDVSEDRPAKRIKTTAAKHQGASNQLSAEQESQLNEIVDNFANRNGPLKNRSLYILKRETPSDDTARPTRSGRISVRPLAYWRNERCVYGEENAEVGQRFPLSTIKEIIRTEEVETSQQIQRKRAMKKKKSKSKRKSDDASDDDTSDHAEAWEAAGGTFVGEVKKWDPQTQTATQEDEIIQVAYAPSGIQTQEVKDSGFKFAKVFSTPFLGAGVVDMPPGAFKKQKNSKRMHMVFFVYRGRIQVNVAGLQFSAGKGCSFQVPRGNNYSFSNDHDKPAAIFFAQGCIPPDLENIEAPVPAAVPEETTEAAEEVAEPKPAPKKRGRPKQGAKT
ncbi:hypothetical protein AJ80_09626 [Polytolypa hystricis UAMH7299]|uniref:CENP-C homolog n=1 Tax=Polytolypa hystricis (strain UAMH7299) TaxID=1447883 RepID=A0A2B7WMM2_POLH7|nr:hypothetical protein AJ80_09626 [Polytolypa hystricis UAMH7299]